MTGIDISEYQSDIAPGAWEFIFCRATHDVTGVDKKFAQHFPAALARSSVRGVYHFARPNGGSPTTQAQHFATVALGNGFRVGVDLWALDFEANALGDHASNVAWIRAFMGIARAALGARGVLYVGWPYFVETCGAENAELLHEFPWWLPAYGVNDGQPHTYQAPFAPVLHQFTSRGGAGGAGLDVSRVIDPAVWGALISSQPKPPAPKPVPPTQAPTIDHGDADVKTTDIRGIHLDPHGYGEVAVQGVAEAHVIATTVIGGSDPLKVGRYDKTPTTRVVSGSNPALVVIEFGEPAGVYTVRVAHS